MSELQASRTLVKSPPELWAECSDAASLARHLGQFGQIRITRLDPETAVAWEGERTRGTVRIEPAGWGTKVILTAVTVSEESPPLRKEHPPVGEESPPALEEPSEPPEEPPKPVQPTGPPRRRRFSWLFARRRAPGLRPKADSAESPPEVVYVKPDPVTVPPEPVTVEPEPVTVEPEPEAVGPDSQPAASDTGAALTAALDSLGQAHHRPYSRA